MYNSNLNDENKKKIEDAIKEAINKSEVNLERQFVDVSESKDENIDINETDSSNNLNKISKNVDSKVDNENIKTTGTELSEEQEKFSSKNNEGDNFFNQVRQGVQDIKNPSKKKNLMPGERLSEKPIIPDDMKKTANDIKNATKPVVNDAKKAANQLKEQGKKVAAKAGGTAISAATGGVIPPKLGEWASKKALNKLEKKTKKKANQLKNNISKKTQKVKEKLGDGAEKIKNKAGKVVDTVGKGIKFAKFITFMQKWGNVIIAGIIVFVVVAGVVGLTSIIQSYLPGIFGDVTQETDSEVYSKRDQKILEDIKQTVNKYPNLSTNDAAMVMATVSYPYHYLLQSDNVTSLLAGNIDQTSDGEEQDKTELLFEDDANLTTKEKFEKYKLIYQSASGAVGEIIEADFKQWFSDTFGYEFEDIEEDNDDDINNDMYLTMYKKDKYIEKLDELLSVYSSKGKEAYIEYLKTDYFENDDGYKDMFKQVSEEDKALLQSEIIDDININAEMYENYIPHLEICTGSMQSAGTVEIDDMLKGNILVDVKVPSCISASNVWGCESMYPAPITLKQYTFGGAYAEYSSMDVEKTAAQMLAIKSYIVDRSKSMGWGIKTDQNGNYVVTARNNTNDLVYCDIETGCNGAVKRGTISTEQRDVYEKAWKKIADKYIYDKDSNKTVGAFCLSRSGVCSFCKKGSCLAHQELNNYTNTSYDTIIGMQYSDYAMIQVEGNFANVTIAASSNCSESRALDIDDSNFVYYAQTDYENVAFCGRSKGGAGDGLCLIGSTICTSGCGLTSIAMVTATLTQNYSINPVTLNNEVRVGIDCGPSIPGSSGPNMFPYVASKYGLSVTTKSINSNTIKDIKQGIDEGGLIIASVCGGLRWENKTYTKPNKSCGGHFIVVRGYEGDSVVISDPYQNNTLKNFSNCLAKKDGKCIKHKLDFNTFYNDLRVKNGYLYIIKGQIPFYELKNQANAE